MESIDFQLGNSAPPTMLSLIPALFMIANTPASKNHKVKFMKELKLKLNL